MPGGYGTGRATRHDEEDRHARAFREEVSGPPPGDKPLADQLLGWGYILTGIGLALVTLRETTASGTVDLATARNVLAIAFHVTVGIAVDAGKPWAVWLAVPLSGVSVYLMGPAGLTGNLVAAVGAILHAILLVAVPIVWWAREPEQPA